MDVKFINPFLDAFLSIMPQLGFKDVKKQGIAIKDSHIKSLGVMLTIGIVGDIKGNVIYGMSVDSAKKIASTMMMGAPIDEFDEMPQSAISELSNMLTANASTNFSNMGININISTPALMYGSEFEVKMNVNNILCIQLLIDDIPMEVNIGIEKG
jgi:chemotaxis protein CheX